MGYAQFLFVFVVCLFVCLFVCSFNVQCYCCLLHARFCFALLKKVFFLILCASSERWQLPVSVVVVCFCCC